MSEEKTSEFFYGYIIVLACFLIQGIGIGTFVAFGVFFKPLLGEFGWSRATLSGASSLAFLLMGFLGILVGNINDKFGPRSVMALGARGQAASADAVRHIRTAIRDYSPLPGR